MERKPLISSLPESCDQTIIDAEIARFKQRMLKTYPVYFSIRRLCVQIRGKDGTTKIAQQAKKLGIPSSTLYRYLHDPAGICKPYQDILIKATKTDPELWSLGGSPEQRRKALDAWWAAKKDKK
jgi:hypothetical protein